MLTLRRHAGGTLAKKGLLVGASRSENRRILSIEVRIQRGRCNLPAVSRPSRDRAAITNSDTDKNPGSTRYPTAAGV